MILRQLEWGHPDSVALRAAQRLDLDARYGGPDSEPGPHPTADDITVFFAAYDDAGTAVGCGALRKLDEEHGEIKRMFVQPASRGSGAAAAILRRLEEYARQLGWTRLVLETGHRQPDAVRFYEREGYRSIPPFGYYADSPNSLCYEKIL
jgi:GNAT superfamily N-acetyltransferase